MEEETINKMISRYKEMFNPSKYEKNFFIFPADSFKSIGITSDRPIVFAVSDSANTGEYANEITAEVRTYRDSQLDIIVGDNIQDEEDLLNYINDTIYDDMHDSKELWKVLDSLRDEEFDKIVNEVYKMFDSHWVPVTVIQIG